MGVGHCPGESERARGSATHFEPHGLSRKQPTVGGGEATRKKGNTKNLTTKIHGSSGKKQKSRKERRRKEQKGYW